MHDPTPVARALYRSYLHRVRLMLGTHADDSLIINFERRLSTFTSCLEGPVSSFAYVSIGRLPLEGSA